MSAENRERVRSYYRKLWSHRCQHAIAEDLAEDYIEHQYSAGFTKQGLADYVERRMREHTRHEVVIHYSLSEDDHVFLLVQEKLSANVDYARAELFRLENGKIAEHWGSQVLDDKNRKNANGTFDGSQVDRTKDYAIRFAENFEALDSRAFNEHDLDAFKISRVPDYRQHSPKGRDGLEGLVEVLSRAKAQKVNFRARRYRTLKDGDFIVSHRIYSCEPAAPLMNHHTFDMFRLNAEGRAVEHWDVMDDELPPRELTSRLV